MARRLTFLTLLACSLLLGVLACSSSRQKVALRALEWSIRGDTAPFSLELENLTDRPIAVTVFVLAESKRESRGGTSLHELGHERLKVPLAAKEKRRVVGQVRLIGRGDFVLEASASVEETERKNR